MESPSESALKTGEEKSSSSSKSEKSEVSSTETFVEAENSSGVVVHGDGGLVDIPVRVRDIKQELVEMDERPPPAAGYSTSEPECITIYDSDEEESPHDPRPTLENNHAAAETIEEEEEDQEVQIVMESETSLYEKVLRNLKVEYIEPPAPEDKVTEEEVLPKKKEDDVYTRVAEDLQFLMEPLVRLGEAQL